MNKKYGNTPKGTATIAQQDSIHNIAATVLKSAPTDNSATSQQARVLHGLILAGSCGITTIQFREHLDVMCAPQRVMELRQEGHRIETLWAVSENAQGRKHRNARYVLIRRAIANRVAA